MVEVKEELEQKHLHLLLTIDRWYRYPVGYHLSVFVLCSSYSKMVEVKEELEQKHLHLLQILDSERQAKWHYVQQTEELTTEVKKLKAEVSLQVTGVRA